MDAFDASPAATFAEDALVARLAQWHGLGPAGSGVMTMGGTASNLLGLLLARDRAGEDVRARGLPPDRERWRIVASAAAHDSVRRSAALLGLGTEAVIGVATDAAGAMSLDALDAAIEGERVIAFVGTAGTTDLGAIDPLDGTRRPGGGPRRVVPRRRGRRLGPRALRPPAPAAARDRARELRHRRPAQAVVDAVRRQRPARAGRRRAARRPPRQRLPQPAGGRGRGPAQPRRALAGHVAALRRAEGPDRPARHRSPPARRDDRHGARAHAGRGPRGSPPARSWSSSRRPRP